jgi:hypothetical protein
MANGRDKRISDLENRSSGGPVIVVDWGDDKLMVNGVEMTRAEFARRYPDHKVVSWDEDDYTAEPIPVG